MPSYLPAGRLSLEDLHVLMEHRPVEITFALDQAALAESTAEHSPYIDHAHHESSYSAPRMVTAIDSDGMGRSSLRMRPRQLEQGPHQAATPSDTVGFDTGAARPKAQLYEI